MPLVCMRGKRGGRRVVERKPPPPRISPMLKKKKKNSPRVELPAAVVRVQLVLFLLRGKLL